MRHSWILVQFLPAATGFLPVHSGLDSVRVIRAYSQGNGTHFSRRTRRRSLSAGVGRAPFASLPGCLQTRRVLLQHSAYQCGEHFPQLYQLLLHNCGDSNSKFQQYMDVRLWMLSCSGGIRGYKRHLSGGWAPEKQGIPYFVINISLLKCYLKLSKLYTLKGSQHSRVVDKVQPVVRGKWNRPGN